MTTRTMRGATLAALTLWLLLGQPTLGSASVGFSTKRTIWSLGNHGPEDIAAADIDGDGDQDLVVALFGINSIHVFENVSGNGSVWTRRQIVPSFGGASAAQAADLDDDGDVDIVGGAATAERVALFPNGDGVGMAWSMEPLGANRGPWAMHLADVDGDGSVDIVVTDYVDDEIELWTNVEGNGIHWLRRRIGSLDGPLGVFAADVDGDGDLDVVGGAEAGNEVAWFSNDDGNASRWTKHVIGTAAAVQSVEAGDIDGDGTTDVLAAVLGDDDVRWWANTAGDGSVWASRTIDGSFAQVETARLADFDADGDLDVVGAAGNAKQVAWWENLAGDGSSWSARRVIQSNFTANEAIAADLDGDGKLDVVGSATPTNDNALVWWRQEARCGDGVVSTGEQCDDGNTLSGDCCSGTCAFEASGESCGAPFVFACTAPDTCDGAGTCLPNHLEAGTPCGDQGVACANDDACDGNGTCADAGFVAAGTVCRAAADACDLAETCTGTDAACPGDTREPDGDGDEVCDAIDLCPLVPDPAQADGDFDGRGDECDPCTNLLAAFADRKTVRLVGLDRPAGEQDAKIEGRCTSFVADSAIDPIANGLRVVLEDTAGGAVLDALLPGGAYDPGTRAGWRVHSFPAGVTATYRNTGVIEPKIEGIQTVKLVWKDGRGITKFAIVGKDGEYLLDDPTKLPLRLSLVLDTPVARSGQCCEALFLSAGELVGSATAGSCATRGNGRVLLCK